MARTPHQHFSDRRKFRSYTNILRSACPPSLFPTSLPHRPNEIGRRLLLWLPQSGKRAARDFPLQRQLPPAPILLPEVRAPWFASTLHLRRLICIARARARTKFLFVPAFES